ncbi:DNA mismatch repair protein MutT [Bacillus pseudomycoides]|uniref:DNA mismatch repair protein MutT n=1 Tax=Bacillus pseudomycoides TaxID=64104 RepID=A0AA91VG79_9BACI|nr:MULTISPECIES: NUDIX hydrolase [Bacillus]PEB50843.1 DNA mismatch repair protein MutT [Bacillus sp. AFS098217]PED84509.1 DNA mismatch repair protein MutT [Bacillus pseudomycoides]PEU14285.1 DNA mismatch repair protein MutT [Bacillus sp. AFS019443]PEU19831.1 DNA mismatch repair protein MutT [Bacillus sp. AFS014408]PFW57677.1 DNA mismatch repair protein MutT [Bacillus sp. AFS075034]
MDLTFKLEKTCFNYRVGAICKQENKILMIQNEGEDFWYVPGGRVQMLEHSAVAVKRELKEELGVNVDVKRLLWTVENFFTYDSQQFHEISFYYEVNLLELPAKGEDTFILEEDGRRYVFQWVPLERISEYNLKPDFLKDKVKDLPIHMEHIVRSE